MKQTQYFILSICFVSLLASCNTNLSTSPTKVEIALHDYSDAYKAPIFIEDNRKEQISKIVPELHKIMVDHGTDRKIPGIAYGIVVDNKLLVSSATGLLDLETQSSATPKSSFRIASMTKSFTAMAIMKLRDEGRLSLNDPVSKYIPEMSNLEYLTEDSPIINIENLLTMTAGFPEDNPWGDRQLNESDKMLIDLIASGVSFSNSASFEFEYSNTGYALLGHIVGHVSGIAYQTYINQNILQPLGMGSTYWEYDNVPKEILAIGYRWEDDEWKLEPMLHDGAFGAMGGLITSIEDFSKYVSYQLSAWPPRSGKDIGPVKRSSLREMQTPQSPSLSADAKDFNGEPCPSIRGYGYGLGITENCDGIKRVSHGGALPGFGSNYSFYPEYGVGIMAFGNLTYTGPLPLAKIEKLLFETAQLKPRQLPVSDILIQRQEQVLELINTWDTNLENEIIAENLYLDKSRAHRKDHAQSILEKAGAFTKVHQVEPNNQLRGSFKIDAANGVIEIFFTLTPEQDPKVQRLDISFQAN